MNKLVFLTVMIGLIMVFGGSVSAQKCGEPGADQVIILEHTFNHNGDRGWAIGFGGTLLTYETGTAPGDPGVKPMLNKRS